MKKVLAIVLTVLMLLPFVLSLPLSVSAAEDESSGLIDFTQGFNVNKYSNASGFVPTTTDGVTVLKKNPNLTSATYAVAQYMGTFDYDKNAYTAEYDVTLSATNTSETMFFFAWQDWCTSGKNIRTYISEGKSNGAGLYVSSNGTTVSFSVLGYNAAGGYMKGSAASGSDELTNTSLLAGASANTKLHYKVSYDATAGSLVAEVSLASNPTVKTTVKFALSEGTNIMANAIGQIKAPCNFAFSDMKAGTDNAVEELGGLNITSKGSSSGVVNMIQGFNIRNYAKGTGFTATGAPNTNTMIKGSYPVATSSVLQYAGSYAYDKTNYSLNYTVKLGAENKANEMTYFYWQDWCKSGTTNIRTFSAEGKAVGAALRLQSDGTTVTVDVLHYSITAGYARINTAKEGDITNTELLAGASENVSLDVSYKFDKTAKELTVTVTRSDDAAKTAKIVFDLSPAEANMNAVETPMNFAIVDLSAGTTGAIEAVSNMAINAKEPVVPVTTIDLESWAYSTDIAVNEDNFDLFVPKLNPTEGFSIVDENLTRTGNDSVEKAEAYAAAKYKGDIVPTDNYKIEFNVKLNSDNRARVALYSRWDDVDFMLNMKMSGFGFIMTVGENKSIDLRAVKYENGRYTGVLSSWDEMTVTSSAILADQPAGSEVKVTVIMVDNKASMSVSLVSDPTKTTGEVIFDLENAAASLASVDKTEKFAIMDNACEAQITPATIGDIKLYLTSVPKTPDPTPDTDTDTDKVTDTDTTATDTTAADTTAAPAETTAPEEKKKGCKSAIGSVAIIFTVASVGTCVAVSKKKCKED